MPFEKGHTLATGRPKGSKDKSTSRAREAIALFVDNRADQIDGWIEEIYKEHGAKDALEAFVKFVEFHVPKLGRTEHSGVDGEAIPVNLEVMFIGTDGNKASS